MKRKLIILLFLAMALALTPIALASPAPDNGATGGSHYSLSRAAVQVSISNSYQLVGPASPDLTGSGCCCTFLPCVLR